MQAFARFATPNGRKYMQQLCRHFAHKVEVVEGDTSGECRFSCGIAALTADEHGLQIEVTSGTSDDLEQTKSVIESHLLRFAFREDPGSLSWREISTGDVNV